MSKKKPATPPEDDTGEEAITVKAEPDSGRGRPPSDRVSATLDTVDAIETDPGTEDANTAAEPMIVVKPPSASDPEFRVVDSSVEEPDAPGPGPEGPPAAETVTPVIPPAPEDPDSVRRRNLEVLDASFVRKPSVPEPSREAGGTIDANRNQRGKAEPEFTFIRAEDNSNSPEADAPSTLDRDDTPIPPDRAPVPMRQAMAEALAREAAAIPHIEVSQVTSRGDDPRLILHVEPDSPRAASFRVLRHRIAGTARVVAVSSALAGEGKSTCAVNLAIALSEHEPTVLLEANTENPSIASMIGFTPPLCATRGYTHVVEAIWPNLHILAVDPHAMGSHIEGDLLRAALEDLQRAGYRYVVIDTPPILGHADVNLIQEVADGVIISAIAGESKAATIQQAINQLTPEKLLGAVLLEL